MRGIDQINRDNALAEKLRVAPQTLDNVDVAQVLQEAKKAGVEVHEKSNSIGAGSGG